MVEEYINSVVCQSLPIALPLAEIQKETNMDKTLSLLKKCIHTNKLKPELKDYHKVHNDISVSNELVMLNNKIIIPSSLQQTVLKLAHEGHQGMVRTKQRLRSKVWWPKMNSDVEQFINSCHSCQIVSPAQPPTYPYVDHSPMANIYLFVLIIIVDFQRLRLFVKLLLE